MKIIAFCNTKGGVGKSTLTTNFACIAASQGKKTLLIDCDAQESSMKFRAIRPDHAPQFAAVSILTPTVHKDIKGFDAEYIFIDAGGRDSKVFRSVLMAAQSVVVPLLPSQYDMWSSEETFQIIDEMREFKEGFKAGTVLNQVIHGTSISNEVLGILDEYSTKYQLHPFSTKLFARVCFKESVSEGLAVTEVEHKKYDKAREEIMSLYNEVLTWD